MLGNLNLLAVKKEPPKVFFTFLGSFLNSCLGAVFVTLFDFRMPFLFLLGGGGASVPAPVLSILEPFFDSFHEKRCFTRMGAHFQPELSSHEGNGYFRF